MTIDCSKTWFMTLFFVLMKFLCFLGNSNVYLSVDVTSTQNSMGFCYSSRKIFSINSTWIAKISNKPYQAKDKVNSYMMLKRKIKLSVTLQGLIFWEIFWEISGSFDKQLSKDITNIEWEE